MMRTRGESSPCSELIVENKVNGIPPRDMRCYTVIHDVSRAIVSRQNHALAFVAIWSSPPDALMLQVMQVTREEFLPSEA